MTNTLIPEWTLGERLAKARRHADLEQADMAEELGLSRVTVSNYEVGKTKPNKPTVILWAAITGVDAGWLLTGDDEGNPMSVCTSDVPRRSGSVVIDLTDSARRPCDVPLFAAA